MVNLASSLMSKSTHCDTDFYELLSVGDSAKVGEISETQAKMILRETFKGAISNPNFDFEACSLKLISTKPEINGLDAFKSENALVKMAENDKRPTSANTEFDTGSMGKRFLLFHTRVYGGSKHPEEHVNYLFEADKIINDNLHPVLLKRGIESKIIYRQYIFYAENIDRFKEIISKKLSNLVKVKVDDSSDMYIGNFLIATISKDNRKTSPKLGFVAEDLVHEIITHPIINQEYLKHNAKVVLSRIDRIDSIQKVNVRKVYLSNMLPTAIMTIIIIFIFLVFFHLYWLHIVSNTLTLLAFGAMSVSLFGMVITLTQSIMKRQDIILKK